MPPVLEFIGRVELFAVERGQEKDLVLDAPTIVQLLWEKLLDFKRVTRTGG